MSRVGEDGEVVIEQWILRQFDVEPGWLVTQKIVGDHLEIRFAPPEQGRSLKGVLGRISRFARLQKIGATLKRRRGGG